MNADDHYLVKLMNTRLSPGLIAHRLGITVPELEQRWKRIQEEVKANFENGYYGLCEQMTTMAHQYQLLGESLKIFGMAIGNVMTDDEIRGLLSDVPETTMSNLKSRAIVLRPFVQVDPEVSIKKTVQGN